jgi:phospholipid transport system substrate-binding protein
MSPGLAGGGASLGKTVKLRRRELAAALAAGVAMWLRTRDGAAQSASAVPDAESFVNELATRGIGSLTALGLNPDERARRFRVLLVENFDVPTIARFELGRYWRVATDAERSEYLRLFENMLVSLYANRFADYSGERIRVTGSRSTAEGDIFVQSVAVMPQQPQDQIALEWVLRRDGARLRIVDVRAEGVSMAITQRDEFGAVIQRGGGRVAALLDAMRARTVAR